MQIDTLKLEYRAVGLAPNAAEKYLNPLNDSHAWRLPKEQRRTMDPNNGYFGTVYGFNTKYMIDCEAHPVVGAWVTLTSGKRIHVDETAESINILANRR